ncbi:hypothetical protein R3P38DRAFT_3303115 [Favolaschia claudopus]|uniref:Uncharacterized protein n=1 Tax=Favolaschia claudopus TaxID=2862362 RepID=A0AAW0EEI0_9AGAR
MGRRAKYLSLEEKTSAKRKSDIRYTESTHGKTVRSAYRESSRRSKQRHIPSTTPPPHTLPLVPSPTPRQLELYRSPLPTHSHLFAEALRSPDALDESELARWKTEPPFEEDSVATDPHSAPYLTFTTSLTEVLHGIRLREQNQRDAELREQLLMQGQEGMLQSVRYEVLKMSQAWRRVERLENEGLYHPYHQSREYAMLGLYLRWLASSICHLYYLKFIVE